MIVLVACEESQAVCKAFRERGHEAYSCDIQECSGGHPEWHIKCDVRAVLLSAQTPPFCVETQAGKEVIINRIDLLIAHPPCTYLSTVATRSHSIKCTPYDKITQRTFKRIDAMEFFMMFVDFPCDKICIENPKGVMNTAYRKPDQFIHPWMFADSESDTENYVTKGTCLWLKGLNPLIGKESTKKLLGQKTMISGEIEPVDNLKLYGVNPNGKVSCWEERTSRAGGASKARSKTFKGIAKAMAEQWG